MVAQSTLLLKDVIRHQAKPLVGEIDDYDPLLKMIGDARLVLIGEASHGTHEFYRERAQITKQLIQEKGFAAVAVEAGWPDAYRVNQYVRWDGPAERKYVRPALGNSYESLFHSVGLPRFLLTFRNNGCVNTALREPKLERAIGVIYRPETERYSHYIHARLSDQFDAVIHFDETRAVEPLERTSEWDVGEVPETFPTGI